MRPSLWARMMSQRQLGLLIMTSHKVSWSILWWDMEHLLTSITCRRAGMFLEGLSIIKDFLVRIMKWHGSSKTPPRMVTVLCASTLNLKKTTSVSKLSFLMTVKLTSMENFRADEHPKKTMKGRFSSFPRQAAILASYNGSLKQIQELSTSVQTLLSSTRRVQYVMANVSMKECARMVNVCVEQASKVIIVKLQQVSLWLHRGRRYKVPDLVVPLHHSVDCSHCGCCPVYLLLHPAQEEGQGRD